MPTTLRTRVLPLDAAKLTASDVDRWRALVDAAVEPNPFFEPVLALAASEHLGERGVSLLVVEDDAGWRACMPVRANKIERVVPGLRTWGHLYCFLGTPLLDADHAVPAARSLLGIALASRRPLTLATLTDGGPASSAIDQAAADLGLVTIAETRHERAFLERRPAGDYLDSMRSHRRRELDRLGRRLEAELDCPLSVVDEAGQDAAVDRFLELERSGWKGRADTALGSSAGHAAFFRTVCRAFAAEGRLQLLALSADKRTVAMKCNLYAGEGGFCFKIAYDEELARFSPGVQLERENVRLFHHARSERWQDSCADPENGMINRLWPDRRRIRTTVLARRGVRAEASRHGIRAVRAIRESERRKSSTRS